VMTPERLQTVSCTLAYRSAGEGNARARLAGSARHSVQHRRNGALPHCRAKGIRRFRGDNGGLAKSLGRSHDLARWLWDTGWYEAGFSARSSASRRC
jgi:hypothetical protein